MAQKQIEDAYNSATPLERAERWPKTDREREYQRLRQMLSAAQEKNRGHVSDIEIEGAILKTKRELERLGYTES